MQSGGGGCSLSPSFNAYSSSDCRSLAQIAGRVVSEFRHELDEAQLEEIDDVYNNHDNNETDDGGGDGQLSPPFLEQLEPRIPRNDGGNEAAAAAEDENEEEESEFEFACVSRDALTSPVSAEEVFYNGQIRPVYPVFDQTLLYDDVDKYSEKSAADEIPKPRQRRQQLRMLMREEAAASCSSSESDELENLTPGTYCVWAPPAKKDGNKIRVKSGSTGSSSSNSKRWKFRDLLSRSSSEGAKGSLVILSPKAKNEGGKNVVVVRKVKRSEEGDKRRSFLPYKQDLVGFFTNVNGLNRNLHPF